MILKDGYNIERIFETSKDIKIKTQLKGIYITMKSYFNSQN